MISITKILFISAVILAISVQAMDQDAQLDILISKLKLAQKEHKYADALTAMDKIKELSNRLNEPISENFQYIYIDTLEKNEDYVGVIEYANDYIRNFGRKGTHYQEIIEKIALHEDKAKVQAKRLEFVWIDKETNLMWQDEPYTGEELAAIDNRIGTGKVQAWQGAIDYCKNLVLAGYSDWRLPIKEELTSLSSLGYYGDHDANAQTWLNNNKNKQINESFMNPSLKSKNQRYTFDDTWSSTMDVSNPSKAWTIRFYSGKMMSINKQYMQDVRCVRNNK